MPLLLVTLLACLAASAAAFLPSPSRFRRGLFASGMLAAAAASVIAVLPALLTGSPLAQGPLRIDRFGAYVICLVAVVASLATFAALRYLAHDAHSDAAAAKERTFCFFFPLFALSMWTAAAANHLALLWIALESTTLTTTLLVAFDRSRGAVEAAWKYIVICSTGITLGLLGMLMLIHSAAGADLGSGALTLSGLAAHAGGLAGPTLRWAFVFLFVGIGTKVGFVPMHTWLPDAHGKTPAPVSAALSGILLSVAFTVLLRVKPIVDAALGAPAWTQRLFLAFGLLSIALPALIMLVQKNYKRMLAYSSIEHMGLMAFSAGLGPVGLLAAIIHMAGHALAKPALFVGAGELLQAYGSARIDGVRGAMRRLPKTGALIFLGLFALLAAPPSALFISEFLMTTAGMRLHPILTLTVLLLLVIAAYGMMRSILEMLFSPKAAPAAESAAPPAEAGERWNLSNAVMLVSIALCAAFGLLLMTGPVFHFFTDMTASLSAL